jgi:hypothetical protein
VLSLTPFRLHMYARNASRDGKEGRRKAAASSCDCVRGWRQERVASQGRLLLICAHPLSILCTPHLLFAIL